jgi:hypothetical protein
MYPQVELALRTGNDSRTDRERESGVPSSSSSTLMRAVTFECTVWSSAAARFMLPFRATDSKNAQVGGIHGGPGYRKRR